MEIVYRAHDGKEFSNEKECIDYEKVNYQFYMFDIRGNKTDNMDRCLILKIDNKKSAKYIQDVYKDYELPEDIYVQDLIFMFGQTENGYR